ncbi:MAG: hypothetical protein Q8P02_02455, partial [Candidatus Micrarchaeota archaeon]|nr:hypothetical protein [Candidatus Micrarchaeota archaeon]
RGDLNPRHFGGSFQVACLKLRAECSAKLSYGPIAIRKETERVGTGLNGFFPQGNPPQGKTII